MSPACSPRFSDPTGVSTSRPPRSTTLFAAFLHGHARHRRHRRRDGEVRSDGLPASDPGASDHGLAGGPHHVRRMLKLKDAARNEYDVAPQPRGGTVPG